MSMPATAYANFTEAAQVRNMELGLLVDASAVAAGLRNNSAPRYGKGTSNRYRHLDFPSSWPAYMCGLCVDTPF